jgi:hypothetical protein
LPNAYCRTKKQQAMANQNGLHKIQGLRNRWIVYHVLEDALLSVYAGLYIGAIIYYLLSSSLLWGIIVFPIAFVILLAINRPWQMSGQKIAAFLNK